MDRSVRLELASFFRTTFFFCYVCFPGRRAAACRRIIIFCYSYKEFRRVIVIGELLCSSSTMKASGTAALELKIK